MNLDEDSDDAASQSADEDVKEDEESDEEEQEEEGDPEEFIDILDMLDGRGGLSNEDHAGKVGKEGHSEPRIVEEGDEEGEEDEGEEDDEEEDDEEEDEEEEEEDDDDDDDELVELERAYSVSDDEDPNALANLETFITTLDAGQKRKAPDGESTQGHDERARKKRLLKEQTQVGVENEFAAQPGKQDLLQSCS